MLSYISTSLITSLMVAGLGVGLSGESDNPPERARTLTYDPVKKEWVESPPPTPGTSEGDLYLIRRQLGDKKYRRAMSSVKSFIKTYGDSDAGYSAALIARAEALMGRRKHDKAHEVLQAFLNEFAGMSLTDEALRLEFIIAERYLGGQKRKFLGMRLLSAVDYAYRMLDDISINYPDSSLAEAALKTKADHMFAAGDHALAELEYARMLKEYPTSRYHQYALRRTAEAALASHAGLPYDEAALIEAQERYREYQVAYPGSASVEGVGSILATIRQQRAEKQFINGHYYERTGHLTSAVFYYKVTRDEWPETVAATKAAGRLRLLGA